MRRFFLSYLMTLPPGDRFDKAFYRVQQTASRSFGACPHARLSLSTVRLLIPHTESNSSAVVQDTDFSAVVHVPILSESIATLFFITIAGFFLQAASPDGFSVWHRYIAVNDLASYRVPSFPSCYLQLILPVIQLTLSV